MSFWLPFGFDKADGKQQLPFNPVSSSGVPAGPTNTVGTPDPDGCVQTFGNASGYGPDGVPTSIEQPADSPEIERAEQATFQQRTRMSWATAKQFIYALGRGTFVKDANGNLWRILSSKIQAMRGNMGELSVCGESISFDTPPDDFQLTPVDLGINIIKHPRYFYALYPTAADFVTNVGSGGNVATIAQVKSTLIRAIQTYQDSPFFPSANNINGLVQNDVLIAIKSAVIPVQSGGTKNVDVSASASCLMALAAAGEIIQKMWFQLDNPYFAGVKMVWSQYFFAPVYVDLGGYIQDPVGIVPEYFISTNSSGNFLPRGQFYSVNANNDTDPPPTAAQGSIFDMLAIVNPQAYSDIDGKLSISWLRQADEIEFQRTWFKVTHTWIGSPIGHWDAQLFSHLPRPTLANYNDPSFAGSYLPLPA